MEKKCSLNAPLPENIKLMNYQIIRVIAQGSSSFVYLAKDDQKNLVAIKEYFPHRLLLRKQSQLDLIILPEHRREFRQYLKTFLSEYRILSRIAHPAIVGFVDFFRAHNTFYIVTKYEPGSSLKDFIRRRIDCKMGQKKDSLLNAYLRYRRYKKRLIGPHQVIGERLIRKIFSQLTYGINALHDQELLYLDLKPDNIYLLYDGTPLLLDLGAVRCPSEKNWRKLNWVSTQGFAAPELVTKKRTLMGPWTDAYGIGATIFACMCSYPPQSAEHRIVEDKLHRSFKTLRTIYSNDLIDLVEWCLRLEPGQRPQTMEALQDRLLACQLNPVPLPRRKFTRRFCKWVRKKIKTVSPAARYS